MYSKGGKWSTLLESQHKEPCGQFLREKIVTGKSHLYNSHLESLEIFLMEYSKWKNNCSSKSTTAQ